MELISALCDSQVLYARLFSWLVTCINGTLAGGGSDDDLEAAGLEADEDCNGGETTPRKRQQRGQSALATPPHRVASTSALSNLVEGGEGSRPAGRFTIGLLDIYGFESFESNDLEQVIGGQSLRMLATL
jgi:hypothetical protein